MPRAIAFDPDDVLARAMDVFWEKGFEATTLPDVERATGLNRSSLYNTFGSMRDVYYAALDGYRRRTSAEMHDVLSAGTALDALRAYFDRVVQEARGEHGRRGCFLANAAVELSPSEPEAARRATESFAGIRAAFQATVERGQREGDVPPGHDAGALAALLLTGLLGLRVGARSGEPESVLTDSIDGLLASLK